MSWTPLITDDGKKICRGCRKPKPLIEFYRTTDNSTGFRARCKSCTTKQNKAWRKVNPKKHRAIVRRANHRNNLSKRFGITEAQFDELWSRCDGRCAICGDAESRDRRLSLDHDHETGELRGFLCSRCNLILGQVKDSPELLERAVVYLKRPAIQPTVGVEFLPGFKD